MRLRAVEIRAAAHADAETLTALGTRTFRDSFAADNTPEDMERSDPQRDLVLALKL